MSESQVSLSKKALKTTSKGEKLIEALKARNVDASSLVVLMMGSETIIGEAVSSVDIPGPIVVLNPKRLSRLQQVTRNRDGSQSVAINFMLGDMDLIEDGEVCIHAQGGCHLGSLGPTSTESHLALYDDFLTRKAAHLKEQGREESGSRRPS